MCTEYDSTQYCPIIGGYCYTSKDSFTRQPCLLCGNNCKVSFVEQFEIRNSLCEVREQMYRMKEDGDIE